MIFHKASEERKWKQWKEQEERILRESGVSEGVIQRLRELDWQDFNTERRYWEHFSPNQEELYTKELEEQSPVALTIQQLLDSVENEQLLQILLESDKKIKTLDLIVSENKRVITGMQKTLNFEISNKINAENSICLVDDCALRTPPKGTYKKETA